MRRKNSNKVNTRGTGSYEPLDAIFSYLKGKIPGANVAIENV